MSREVCPWRFCGGAAGPGRHVARSNGCGPCAVVPVPGRSTAWCSVNPRNPSVDGALLSALIRMQVGWILIQHTAPTSGAAACFPLCLTSPSNRHFPQFGTLCRLASWSTTPASATTTHTPPSTVDLCIPCCTALQDGAAGDEGARPRRRHQRGQRRFHRHPQLAAAVRCARALLLLPYCGCCCGCCHSLCSPRPPPRRCCCTAAVGCLKAGAGRCFCCCCCILWRQPGPPQLRAVQPVLRLNCSLSTRCNAPTPPLLQCMPPPRRSWTACRAASTPSTRPLACACSARRPCLWRPR